MSSAEVWWAMAMLGGTGAAVLLARRARLDSRVAYWAAAVALLGGVIGGLLLGFYDYGLPSGPFNPLSRGKSFLGGLFGGVLGAVAYLRIRRVSAARYGDVLVAALALGYAVGRVGCFFNGCDYGVCTPLPWGHSYPPGTEAYAAHLARGWITAESPVSLPVHPVQLYASACGFVIFAILLARKPPWPGANLCLFAISYGAYRYCIEFLRGDFHSFVLGLSLPQAVSILLVAGGVAFSLWKTSRGSARMSALRLVGANSRAGALPRPP